MTDRQQAPYLAVADLATHNNVLYSETDTVFDQHSPIMKLRLDATSTEYIGLLGLLNSSIACFWLKQVCHNRGAGDIGGGLATESWERFYEFDNTRLKQFPISADMPILLAEALQGYAEKQSHLRPEILVTTGIPTVRRLEVPRFCPTRCM
jgi:hypothetical protein